MGEIVRFPGITKLNVNPDLVLQEAMGKLEGVIVIGYDKEGNEFFSSSYADGGFVVWHIERVKYKLMQVADNMSGD